MRECGFSLCVCWLVRFAKVEAEAAEFCGLFPLFRQTDRHICPFRRG